MDNRTVAVAPGQDTAHLQEPAPAAAGRRGRSPFDSEGREKRYVFTRRMNSAALALFADTLISLISTIGLVVLLMLAFVVFGIINMDFLESMSNDILSDPSSFQLPDELTLLATIATMLTMPISHMIPAYMHSVRNNFSIMSTLKPGKKLGLTLPAAIIVALGCVYGWTFIYAVCGQLMPNSFFAETDAFGASYVGMDLATMIVSAVGTSILVPIAEEFLFRGALLKSLSKYGTGFAVTATSLLFGLMHGNMFQTPFAFAGGFVMAYVAVRSGSIWPSIIVHMSINSYSGIREILMAVLPGEYQSIAMFVSYSLCGVFLLAAVIILCTCAKRISWQPIDRASNNVLLPQVETKVRYKLLRMVFSFGMLLFILLFTFSILLSCGVDFGVGDMLIGRFI